MIEIENLVGKEKEIVSAENKAAAALDRVFVQPETPGMFFLLIVMHIASYVQPGS